MYKVARKYTIGVDEVGRGSCAGPLFVCALGSQMGVSLSKGGNSLPFRDSKKLSEIQREKWLEIFQKMKKDGKIFWSISRISPSVIDKIGISEATKLAATRATLRVVEKHGKPRIILLDGSLFINQKNKLLSGIPTKTIIRGDEKKKIIAAASIVAKVKRDRFMKRLSKKHPYFKFEEHKGYGTLKHRKRVGRRGASDVHRLTFISGWGKI